MQEELKTRYALYVDLKELHELVVPTVNKFDTLVKGFVKDNSDIREIIRVFDEQLALKANKTDAIDMRLDLNQKTYKKETEELEHRLDRRMVAFRAELKKVDHTLIVISQTMSAEVFEAVKKANQIVVKG
jgi:hypothetical protein